MYQNNRININSEKDIYDIYYSKDEPVLSKDFEQIRGADSHNSVIICDSDFFMCISWYNDCTKCNPAREPGCPAVQGLYR